MNTVSFVGDFRRAVINMLQALDAASVVLGEYGDLGDANTLDIYFANNAPTPSDPLTKTDIIAAGGAVQVLLNDLGSGPVSNRAKLNKLR